MDFTQSLIDYYKGERLEAIWLTFFGLLCLGISLVMWPHLNQNQMLKGLFYPVAFLCIFTLFSGSYGIYNNGLRLETLPISYATNPAEFIQAELTRFDGKNGVNT